MAVKSIQLGQVWRQDASNQDYLVTKVYMPRLAFPISAVGAQLLDFVISAVVIVLLLIAAQIGLRRSRNSTSCPRRESARTRLR